MNASKIVDQVIELYYNQRIPHDKLSINSFVMKKDYFLDVFSTRYAISLDLNKPIKGLRESLDTIKVLPDQEIQSISVVGDNIDLIIYSDINFNDVYGVLNFC